ncbi:potassium channel family protein [Jidongwangia harbinensis]|uniref:potassium channel family protein n=1 Tax=Jidongwangia harbinensis TaxID=2878561 RepID=UPI001CD93A30|nr:TrkA family potassium uptake protein [Jidongwangia harbinensis]MCA2213616.1 TrkA family potassium uptake protein [Jidongwangia harbinensis]
MSAEAGRDGGRRSLVSRLQGRLSQNGADGLPHFVVCGSDALVYTLVEELSKAGHRIRITVVLPYKVRADVPDLTHLRSVRVIRSNRLDEATFRTAGLAGAAALALVMPDDVVNLHAALCAQSVEPDLRLVIRMFNTGLGYGVRKLFDDCAVLSDADMAAPSFVAAALGEVAPTHFRHAGRTLYMTRRADVSERRVVCTLTTAGEVGETVVLPAEPAGDAARPTDLVLAEATGQAAATRRLTRAARRRRPLRAFGRAVGAALSRKLGIAVLITLGVTAVAGTVLALADEHVDGFWQAIYVTLLTAVGSSDVEDEYGAVAQAAQLVLTISGLAFLPLITAAVVEGMVNARLALSSGKVRGARTDHVVLVGLGSVGTRVLRQLTDLGMDVVAIDRQADARGAKVAEQLGVPLIVADAALEETLRAASVDAAQALVVVSTDDPTNLQAALNARSVRSDLRVVLRLFDDDFARRVQTAFNIGISRSVSRLAAPAFAASMLDRDVLATIPVDRHALLVASVRILPGAPLDGAPLSRVDRPESVRVIGMSAADSEWVDWSPDPRRVLAAGDRAVVVARRAGLRALLEQATPPPVAIEGIA